MRVVALSLIAGLGLAGCDPAELVDSALKRTAHSVVFPVVNIDLPAEPARLATKCILDAASQEELQLLARDVGVEAGTATKATIRDIAVRPAAQSCYAANGVPPVVGG
ncbi:MAG: hypothetical protein C0426_02000 [Rhodobacter sp.]|nr:hypothetical protein [Rhodobacter sp.]MBS3980498.1 hypothetical protein [Paracoccaceae bacterium]